jgi:hypothetical protein
VDLSSVLVVEAGMVVMAMREMGKSEGARAGTGPECSSGQEVEGEGAYPRGATARMARGRQGMAWSTVTTAVTKSIEGSEDGGTMRDRRTMVGRWSMALSIGGRQRRRLEAT